MGGLTWWCWHRRHKTSMVKLGIKKHRFETWRDSLARKKTCRNETIFIVIFMVILFVPVCLGTRFFDTDTHTSFTSLYRYNVYIYIDIIYIYIDNIYILVDTISICIQYLYVYTYIYIFTYICRLVRPCTHTHKCSGSHELPAFFLKNDGLVGFRRKFMMGNPKLIAGWISRGRPIEKETSISWIW